MNDDLASRIRSDLEKSGMRSELFARRIFIENGWSLSGGAAFLDRDEGKSREIDISAAKVGGIDDQSTRYCHCEFHVIAEVKKSERPWVVFKRVPPSWGRLCAWNNLIPRINLPCKPGKLADALSRSSLVSANGWEGTGIHESFKNPDQPSRWYSAFVSVSKAADGFAGEYAPDGAETTDDVISNPTELYFYQPLVILDGQLVAAELSESGELVLEEVQSAAFRFT
jgi:hypothetical protein